MKEGGMYIDLLGAIKNEPAFDEIIETLAKSSGLTREDKEHLLRYNDERKRFKFEYCFGSDGRIMLVSCNVDGDKLYENEPSALSYISIPDRALVVVDHDDEGDEIETAIHPSDDFFVSVYDLLDMYGYANWLDLEAYSDAPEFDMGKVVFPNENAFNDTTRDTQQPNFEIWHNTKAINALLKGLLEKGQLNNEDANVAMQYIQYIPEYTDMYCMLLVNQIDVTCTKEDKKVNGGLAIQRFSIALATNQVTMFTKDHDTLIAALSPEYKALIVDVLKQYRKDNWVK